MGVHGVVVKVGMRRSEKKKLKIVRVDDKEEQGKVVNSEKKAM